MARPFQRRTCALPPHPLPRSMWTSGKKRETRGARKYVRFYHFDAHTYSSRGDVRISFHRTMCLMLTTKTWRVRKTSCHDTATGGGINYLSSRVTPRSREAIPSKKDRFRVLVRNNHFVARGEVPCFFSFTCGRQPVVRFTYIPDRVNNSYEPSIELCERFRGIATWFFCFNVLYLMYVYHPCTR